MKIKLLAIVLSFLVAVPLMALPPKGKDGTSFSTRIDNTSYIDVNKIFMFVTNRGGFGRDLDGFFGYDYGTWFPYTGDPNDIANNINSAGDKSPNYASGLWLGGLVNGDLRVAISEYNTEYVPGPMFNNTFQADQAEYKTYKIYRDSMKTNPNQDYLDYMADAVNQGAPTVLDSEGELVPDLVGDQMLWSVYNDADVNSHRNKNTNPLGLEIKQTVFGFDDQGALGNIVFFRYRIYNNGGNTIDSLFLSLWCDPDLGDAGDDLVGCDTSTALGFVYNETNNDGQYGDGPPSMGFDFFQGPLINTGNPDDTARMWDSLYTGYTNMGMVSFNKYINGTDPDNADEVWLYMLGWVAKDVEPYVYNGDTLLYQHSGDPVTGAGDLDASSADRRWMQTTGPITFAPGDSTEILAAIVIGQDNTNITSITKMREIDKYAQRIYENGFNPPRAPQKPNVTVAKADEKIIFSWDDTSEVDPGDYRFEGYTVWQGQLEGSQMVWEELATYDEINDRGFALIDTVQDTTGLLIPVVKKKLNNAGLNYTYTADKDVFTSEQFNNLSTYFFKVEAFSFAFYDEDPLSPGDSAYYDKNGEIVLAGDRFKFSETEITVVPQSLLGGESSMVVGLDTLDVIHRSGPVPSGGQIIPIVLDPSVLTGHDYRVLFVDEIIIPPDSIFWNGRVFPGPDTLEGPLWNIFDLTNGDTLQFAQSNQSGDDEYIAFDGMLVKVVGPPLAVDTWDWTDGAGGDGYRELTGVNWGGSGFFGGLGVGDEFFGTSLTPADMRAVEIRWVAPGTGQNGYVYRRDDGYNYYGYYGNQNIEVWEVTSDPPRQINFAFVESYDGGTGDGHAADSIWNPTMQENGSGVPDDLGGREYFFALSSDYSATALPEYEVDGACFGFDALFGLWAHQRDDVLNPPDEGDVFLMVPYFINTPSDTFDFTAPAVSLTQNEDQLDKIKPVPNPFYMNGPYDPNPGNYRIMFNNLPEECTITIYNLAGDLVRTIEKENPDVNYEHWDILTDQGLPVASGIYIYVVDAPGFGQKVGKMAVFVEQEVLRIY